LGRVKPNLVSFRLGKDAGKGGGREKKKLIIA